MRHDLIGRLCLFVLGLHGIESLSDEPALHGRGSLFHASFIIRRRHLTHNIRRHAVLLLQVILDALNLHGIFSRRAAALDGRQPDAEVLPIRANQADVLRIPFQFALRHEEGATHLIRLHRIKHVYERLFFREAAEREDH